MKEQELRQHANCSRCKKKIGHTGLPMFWTVDISRHGIKGDAVRRQDGLGAFLGNPYRAKVMGLDEDMTQTLIEKHLTLCENCVMNLTDIWVLTELGDG